MTKDELIEIANKARQAAIDNPADMHHSEPEVAAYFAIMQATIEEDRELDKRV